MLLYNGINSINLNFKVHICFYLRYLNELGTYLSKF